MKKTFIMMLLAVVAQNINAQIVVDNRGHVAISHTTPRANFDITRVGVPGDSAEVCINFYSKNPDNKNIALRCKASGGSNYACGIVGLVDSVSSTNSSAAIYGAPSNSNPYFAYTGNYAGYFNGNVRVIYSLYSGAYLTPSGGVYSTGAKSGSLYSPLSFDDESVTDKLSQLQAFQFQRFIPSRENPEETDRTAQDNSAMEETNQLSPVQFGLDPVQLKEVYPELVYEDAEGNVSINYVEMVPLLVQSINELSQKINELEKGTSAKKAKSKTKTTAVEETASEVDMVRMDQNKPNPFSESTVITLNIPNSTQTANIFIYDMSGKQVKGIPVGERGETNITVYASDLTEGMYIYALVVDGKVKVTRKMIVSEV